MFVIPLLWVNWREALAVEDKGKWNDEANEVDKRHRWWITKTKQRATLVPAFVKDEPLILNFSGAIGLIGVIYSYFFKHILRVFPPAINHCLRGKITSLLPRERSCCLPKINNYYDTPRKVSPRYLFPSSEIPVKNYYCKIRAIRLFYQLNYQHTFENLFINTGVKLKLRNW